MGCWWILNASNSSSRSSRSTNQINMINCKISNATKANGATLRMRAKVSKHASKHFGIISKLCVRIQLNILLCHLCVCVCVLLLLLSLLHFAIYSCRKNVPSRRVQLMDHINIYLLYGKFSEIDSSSFHFMTSICHMISVATSLWVFLVLFCHASSFIIQCIMHGKMYCVVTATATAQHNNTVFVESFFHCVESHLHSTTDKHS